LVTESHILGRVGFGVYILMSGLDVERTLGAAGPLGWVCALCNRNALKSTECIYFVRFIYRGPAAKLQSYTQH